MNIPRVTTADRSSEPSFYDRVKHIEDHLRKTDESFCKHRFPDFSGAKFSQLLNPNPFLAFDLLGQGTANRTCCLDCGKTFEVSIAPVSSIIHPFPASTSVNSFPAWTVNSRGSIGTIPPVKYKVSFTGGLNAAPAVDLKTESFCDHDFTPSKRYPGKKNFLCVKCEKEFRQVSAGSRKRKRK